jgi:hypothetical protein
MPPFTEMPNSGDPFASWQGAGCQHAYRELGVDPRANLDA